MPNAKEMKEVYDAMERICIETSEVLKALDDLMNKQGFGPTGTALRWEQSGILKYPESWMPYFSQRMYRKKKEMARAIGINIMFKDQKLDNKIVFASCGIIDGPDAGGTKSDELYLAGWQETSKEYKESKIYYTHFEKCAIWNYFIPLHIIKDLETLEKYVVKPLILMYDAGTELEKRINVSDFAITLKDIKAE